MKKALLALFGMSFLLFFACGGGGDKDLPSERPDVDLYGYAADAAIEGGTVTAYSWKKGTKGFNFGSTETDENGYYEVPIKAESQPILLELTGGRYTEEASNRQITLDNDDVMFAVINYDGSEHEVMITPYTTLAKGLAEYYVSEGSGVEKAINDAMDEIIKVTDFNITEEYPINITMNKNESDYLSEGHAYGFLCAALSSWSAEISEENKSDIHSVFTGIYLTQLMYRDVVYDGSLNGYGIDSNNRPGNLLAGSIALDPQTYRLKIGQHIIKSAGAEYNRTGLTVFDVLEYAHDFSQKTSKLFDDADPLPLDDKGPTVIWTEPEDRLYRKTADYSFSIEDFVGTKSIAVSISGDPLATQFVTGSTAQDITVTINTEQYADGYHEVQVVASDMLGNVSSNKQEIYIDNSSTHLNLNVNSQSYQSNVSVYKYDNGTKGELLAQGQTDDDGSARLEIFIAERPILVELSGGSYNETGTGGRIKFLDGQKLVAVANCWGQDLTVNVTPLTHVAAAKAIQIAHNYTTFQEAVDAANEYISKIYGIESITKSGIIDITDPNNATSECSDAHKHSFILAGLSIWTSDAAAENGAYNQAYYNSILLSEKMKDDISDDGMLNGVQEFGSVTIDAATYQNGFGSSIQKVIESNQNATKIDLEGFIGIELYVAEYTQESQVLSAGFTKRGSMVNKDLLSDEYTLNNQTDTALFIKIEDIGDQNSCEHEYFEAVREHVVRRHRKYRYRASLSWPYDPGRREWKEISKYHVWENTWWNTIYLKETDSDDLKHYADALPANTHKNWHYFISEIPGDVQNYSSDNPGNPQHSLPGATGPKCNGNPHEMIYDYCLETELEPSNSEAFQKACFNNRAWSFLKKYQGPMVGTGHDSCYVLEKDLHYLTHEWHDKVTPSIQRDYDQNYETISGPKNVIIAEDSDSYSFNNSSITVEKIGGGSAETNSGYYVLPANDTIVIRKYITTPNITLYSGGEVNYTQQLFDNSLTWQIQKSIRLSIQHEGEEKVLPQMPKYETSRQHDKSYVVKR